MHTSLETNQFVDTNILVYAYNLSARHKIAISNQWMIHWRENGNGCLSIQVLQELFVTVTRKIVTPLDHQIARQIAADLAYWKTPVLMRTICYRQLIFSKPIGYLLGCDGTAKRSSPGMQTTILRRSKPSTNLWIFSGD